MANSRKELEINDRTSIIINGGIVSIKQDAWYGADGGTVNLSADEVIALADMLRNKEYYIMTNCKQYYFSKSQFSVHFEDATIYNSFEEAKEEMAMYSLYNCMVVEK